MKKYRFIAAIFFSCAAHAQVMDSFSDGDFTANPAWSGSTSQFIVNGAQQLQLNSTGAGVSYLSTLLNVSSLTNFEWRAFIRQSFSPSSSNFGRVYLVSSQADLTQPLEGYYLQFGEAGSNDAIELFRQSGMSSVSICRATSGAIASSFSLRVDVTRDKAGTWKILTDYSGGTNFSVGAAGVDSTYDTGSYFGIICVYTASNASKFYYDDFYAGAVVTDNTPPQVVSIEATSFHNVTVTFSEPVDRTSAEIAANYKADHSLGNPGSASLLDDQKTVNIAFDESFMNGVENVLTVSGIKDLASNTMVTSQLDFVFFRASPVHYKDLRFTEILPDPEPPVGLPEVEFVELYNSSSNPIDVAGWTLTDGTSTSHFAAQLIMPGQYWIVTSPVNVSALTRYGNVIGVASFPTLNNEEDILVLKSADRVLIDSVNYSLGWYHDADKAGGGWSLELIDLNNPCSGEDNWAASEDLSGGTPGRQNSINANKPDVVGPRLLRAVPVLPSQVLLFFDEPLDKNSGSTGSFTLTPAPGNLLSARFTDTGLREIQLTYDNSLQVRQLYVLQVDRVSDCSGNLIQAEFSEIHFAVPEPADSLDILINEILFNPRPGGVDFLEVYNQSPRYVNLKNWKLAHFNERISTDVVTITSDDFILAPNSYLVFTSDPVALKNSYPAGREENFFSSSLPSLPDDEGSIAIVNDAAKTIDYFFYSKGLHSKLLKDEEGVSLERVSFSAPTNENQNWESASSQAGFATPGFVNSSARADSATPGGIVVEPEIFTPGSGISDFTKINYKFDKTDFVANIRIVDAQGHPIKTIGNNVTLGADGFFRWDGDRDDGSRARIGYYVVWVEVFNLSGTVKTYRKRVIIAAR